MWDLETIRYMNERATISAQKMVNEGVNSPPPSTKPEPVYPLALLAAKLIVGPPSIIRLIDLLENSESVAEFLTLIREFLPEREQEIMGYISDDDRIRLFCRYFEEQYFPLDDPNFAYEGNTLEEFMHVIPTPLMGFSCDDYEEFMGFRNGFILLLSMVENPYVSYGEGERVPILEQMKVLVGKELTELIPPDGWSPEDIHKMLDKTPYPGVAAFADWIHQTTGCLQLDANYSEYGPCEWSRWLVDDLTEQWPRVIELQGQMNHMYEWLEEDLPGNFRKLMIIMLGKDEVKGFYVPKEQIPLPLQGVGSK